MGKLFWIARREFTSTVATKAFIISVVFLPALMMVAIFLIPRLMSEKAPPVHGSVAVIDKSGAGIAAGLAARLTPEALRAEQEKRLGSAIDEGAATAAKVAGDQAAQAMRSAAPIAAQAAAAAAPDLPEIAVISLPPDSDIEVAKKDLWATGAGGSPTSGRLAIVVVDENAIATPAGKPFGRYSFFMQSKLDDRVQDIIKHGVGEEIINARITSAGLVPDRVKELSTLGHVPSIAVTQAGERGSHGEAQMLLPMAFMMLLWISVISGGQYLLTTTIEEKSNRVMELLLSAASPLQLMTGKIIGQLCVGLLILGIYTSLGSGALLSFKLYDLLDITNIGFLVVYFFIAFFLIAAMMAAAGSTVSDMREAQSLIGPIMMVLVLPMILWPVIARNPNSNLATVLSLMPPFSPFVMILRLASNQPVASWQVAVSIVLGFAAVVIAVWAAAKVFRIGVLMYGKPPNFKTLIKWIRMA